MTRGSGRACCMPRPAEMRSRWPPTCCSVTRIPARTWWAAGPARPRCRRRSAMAHRRRAKGLLRGCRVLRRDGPVLAKENMAFAIGAKRITSMRRQGTGWDRRGCLAGREYMAERAGRGLAVQAGGYRPEDTVLLVRRVKLDPEQVSADPRVRALLHPAPGPAACRSTSWSRTRDHHAGSSSAPTWTCSTWPRRPRSRALVPAPHQHREHLPLQQARRRAAAPAVGLHRDQHPLDVGVADRRHDRRLAAPAHRPDIRRRAGRRPRGPRRQGHDRHLAPGP